ncbi:MAG TPA: hypothetical protein VJL31_13000 [Gemmatimonadales bacterium]|nr:hypothetical protein [Gemmatimonadales bacterium]
MTDIARQPAGLVGANGPITLSVGYNANLGFVLPITIVVGLKFSSPLLVAGLNAYMLTVSWPAGAASTLQVLYGILRPNLTSWTAVQVASLPITAAAGSGFLRFGSIGRDQTVNSEGLCSTVMRFGLKRFGGANFVLNSIKLLSATRP